MSRALRSLAGMALVVALGASMSASGQTEIRAPVARAGASERAVLNLDDLRPSVSDREPIAPPDDGTSEWLEVESGPPRPVRHGHQFDTSLRLTNRSGAARRVVIAGRRYGEILTWASTYHPPRQAEGQDGHTRVWMSFELPPKAAVRVPLFYRAPSRAPSSAPRWRIEVNGRVYEGDVFPARRR